MKTRSFPWTLGITALLVGAAIPRSSAAQEIVRPRTPSLVLRPAHSPAELARLPADTLLRQPPLLYDPWLGTVRRDLPWGRPGPERFPAVTAFDVLTWTQGEAALQRSRLRNEAWASTFGRREDQGLIPELENPLRVPEPLARVFGEGSNFDVQGKLHMAAIFARNTQDPDLRSELLRQTVGTFDLDLDQILDLRVIGSVGTKLDVAVDFNSSRELDSKQLITAAYTGTEDEILKKVEVGDIRVALPPSRFMGANAAVGTFGAQAVAQLGPVDLRILGSRKEGQSTSRSITISPGGGGVLQEVTLDIKDTQFQNNRFFFMVHPDSLAGPRIQYPNKGTTLADPASRPVPLTLDVWLDDGNFTNNRERASKPGVARVHPL
ncbi:MAG TPA: hypothetical protein VM778_01305, partial [Gemmatimonadota bacterium]|nr:hypothetical protein [Gemmatimonadota bacterium]